MKKPKKVSKTPDRELLDHQDQLLKAIMKAVGSLQPGEQLEIRRVKAKKKAVAPKPTVRAKARKSKPSK